MMKINDRLIFFILLVLSFGTVLTIYWIADSPYDTGDGIVHYQIARYSWKYPHLLLDMWGKPLFTLISSPFAQFGIKGMYVFQALMAAISSWLIFNIASQQGLKYAWLAPIAVFFAPVYFAVLNSGLVEVMFGTMFMLSAWLVFKNRNMASALVASAIPFVRPEAYVVLPLLVIIYLYRRKFLAVPLLLTTAIIYSLAGYRHTKDIFWIITQNYKLVGDNYLGYKGSYFHYFGIYDQIWGYIITLLLVVGAITLFWQIVSGIRKQVFPKYSVENFFLFLGCTVGCFVLHSLLCGMPGILNNLGMLRYLSVLIPSSAFIAIIGIDKLISLVDNKFKILHLPVVVLLGIGIVWQAFQQWYFPFRINNEQSVIIEAGRFIQKHEGTYTKICYLHPLLPFYTNLDPYDSNKGSMQWATDREQLHNLPEQSLLVWDSHFMKGEGKTSLEQMLQNPDFKIIKHYKYFDDNLPFEACLFLRTPHDMADSISIPVTLIKSGGVVALPERMDTLSFTLPNSPLEFKDWTPLLKRYSDKPTIEFDKNREYGPVFRIQLDELSPQTKLKSLSISYLMKTADSSNGSVIVVEVKEGKNQVYWEGLVNKQLFDTQIWNKVTLNHKFNKMIESGENTLHVYIWNKDKKNFYVGDFKIDIVIGKSD